MFSFLIIKYKQMIQNYRNPASILRSQFHFQCPICLEQFDQQSKFPMIICPAQHSVCKKCAQTIIFNHSQNSRCPQCRVQITKKGMIQFRHLNQIRKTSKELRIQGSKIKNQINNMQKKQKDILSQLKQQKQKNEWLVKQNQQKQSQIHKLKVQILKLKDCIRQLTAQLESKKDNQDYLQSKQLKHKTKEKQGIIEQNNNKMQKTIKKEQKINKQQLKDLAALISISINIAARWVHPECYNYKQLQLDKNIIIAKNQVLVFGAKQFTKSGAFTVNILRINRWIGLGVADTNYVRCPTLGGKPHLIIYTSRGGNWIAGKNVGNKLCYKVGQQIKINANLQNGQIQWIVNEKIRNKLQCYSLKNPAISWSPFIYLQSQGDSVAILD